MLSLVFLINIIPIVIGVWDLKEKGITDLGQCPMDIDIDVLGDSMYTFIDVHNPYDLNDLEHAEEVDSMMVRTNSSFSYIRSDCLSVQENTDDRLNTNHRCADKAGCPPLFSINRNVHSGLFKLTEKRICVPNFSECQIRPGKHFCRDWKHAFTGFEMKLPYTVTVDVDTTFGTYKMIVSKPRNLPILAVKNDGKWVAITTPACFSSMLNTMPHAVGDNVDGCKCKDVYPMSKCDLVYGSVGRLLSMLYEEAFVMVDGSAWKVPCEKTISRELIVDNERVMSLEGNLWVERYETNIPFHTCSPKFNYFEDHWYDSIVFFFKDLFLTWFRFYWGLIFDAVIVLFDFSEPVLLAIVSTLTSACVLLVSQLFRLMIKSESLAPFIFVIIFSRLSGQQLFVSLPASITLALLFNHFITLLCQSLQNVEPLLMGLVLIGISIVYNGH